MSALGCGGDGGGVDGSTPAGGDAGSAGAPGSGGAQTTTGGAANGGGGSSSGGAQSGGSGAVGGDPTTPGECTDGIDNDQDGLVDYAFDPGCYGPGDRTEDALPRAEEDGFSTFDIGPDSIVVYVSEEGDDASDGSTPDQPVRTLSRAAERVRDGENDFMLLRRGDTFRDQTLGRFKSGRDATHPLVVGSYGDSLELPRIENSDFFINHDGQVRSFLAILDLHFVVSSRDPSDPAFDGAGDGVFRYVGSGSHLLIEGCHLEYGEIVVQSYDAGVYEDVEVRRNVVEKSYHADTCSPGDPNGDNTYRPSGMYSSHVERLTIEGNLFDHNGWNQDVPSACATIYNHNLYLNGTDVVIRDNLLARASSIQIKLRSDTSSDMEGTVIENNHFVEGEIGVSIGGNSEEAFRFVSSTIRRNVLSDIGRSQPTTRTLAWGLDVQDNDGLLIEDNLLLNQHQSGVGNSYAVNLGGATERDVTVRNNLFYRIQNHGLVANPAAGHEGIEVTGNTFADPDQSSCLIDHRGDVAGYTYTDNAYLTSADPEDWFCLGGSDGSLAGWEMASGETGAVALSALDFPDPDRTLESYAESIGLDADLGVFLERARVQTRLSYDPALTASAINDYVRAGFDR